MRILNWGVITLSMLHGGFCFVSSVVCFVECSWFFGTFYACMTVMFGSLAVVSQETQKIL